MTSPSNVGHAISPAGRAALSAIGTNVLTIATGLLIAMSLSFIGIGGGSWLDPRVAARQVLIASVSLVPLVIAARAGGWAWSSIGVTRSRLGRSLVAGATIGLGWLIASGTMTELQQPRPAHLYVLVAAAAVAFSEEVVTRGYVQSRVVAWLGNGRGIVVTALIFAILHVPQRLLAGVLGADLVVQLGVVAAIGLALGVLQQITRNIALPTVVHTAIDWSSRFS